ncbi:uncharacterized protein LOC142166412 [Nicotiana tabacum]|uniref:Uncharacterized protein LOC142166412 n=1 Tax=Nicotiana tabacum TaxID=4097 RepID=A0AC58S9Q4_TOBAC
MAEYEACIPEIRMTADMNIKELLVIGDSDLLIHQVQGEWTTKNIKILPYLHCLKDLCKRFIKIQFKHIPRIHNEFADALAALLSMIQHPDKNYIDPIEIEVRDQVPENATNGQKRALRRLANHFFLNGKALYRRAPDLGLLICVDAAEATRLLEEIHPGTCGPHMDGFTLAKMILRARYFWMTIESDSILYMKKCHQCQIQEDFIQVPPNELSVIGLPWSFASWGMDVIGPIETVALNGHHFILVAIDYFTK